MTVAGMEDGQRLDLIKDEYIMLQGFYEDIDERCITIKGWSITVGLAALGAGFVYSENLFLGAFISGLLFWYLEGYWRGLSFFFARRILDIEEQMRDGTWKGMAPLQVYAAWDSTFVVYGKQTWRYMRKEPSLLPHVLMAVVGLALFLMRGMI